MWFIYAAGQTHTASQDIFWLINHQYGCLRGIKTIERNKKNCGKGTALTGA